MNAIAADTSFYSCIICYLQNEDCLYHFLDCYNFYVGNRLLEEIPYHKINESIFKSKIQHTTKYEYIQLMLPVLDRNEKHVFDGEYEAIGIAHFLQKEEKLKYLIIDEKIARNFVKRVFSHLTPYLHGTIGFIEHCCCTDEYISTQSAIRLLEHIKELTKTADKNSRPCSMDKKNYLKIIEPTIKRIREFEDGRL
ncbi:hypothetical protein [Methanobacterium petrolearium]|uniref:hypothetical protein n=1 Tax=Methanobacterium petrolearium TaxID=710190 RepID=UPI001AE62751|nr:hypothetical protein [Methanobacterium petrolearium]MBP1946317.1 putative nucleic acid-binding protein [Methanobacterium petrolearium]BDZ71417.1 hypothetical protein GCM10025861_19340 [Methanobacterium petrolearium]